MFGQTLRLLPYFMCANSGCAVSPEPSLFAYAISAIISCAGSNIQSPNPVREIHAASVEYLSCLQWLKEGLWQGKKPYGQLWGNTTSMPPSYEGLYDKAQSAFLFNGSTRDWFRTTVGVRQGCLLSSIFFISSWRESWVKHWMTMTVVSWSKDGLLPTSAFADDIVLNAEEEVEADVSIQPPQGSKCGDKLPKWLP